MRAPLHAALLVLLACSAVHAFDYFENGADWPDTCANGEQQSPINVVTESQLCDNRMYFSWTPSEEEIDTEIETAHQNFKSLGAWSTLKATSLETG
jgi:hypothetical protein